MHQTTKTRHATFQDAYHTLARRLEGLLHTNAGHDPLEDLGLIESLLHSLPLATDFGWSSGSNVSDERAAVAAKRSSTTSRLP